MNPVCHSVGICLVCTTTWVRYFLVASLKSQLTDLFCRFWPFLFSNHLVAVFMFPALCAFDLLCRFMRVTKCKCAPSLQHDWRSLLLPKQNNSWPLFHSKISTGNPELPLYFTQLPSTLLGAGCFLQVIFLLPFLSKDLVQGMLA